MKGSKTSNACFGCRISIGAILCPSPVIKNVIFQLILHYEFIKFKFNCMVTYCSIFFCVKIISSTLVLRKQRNTLRFGMMRLIMKCAKRPYCVETNLITGNFTLKFIQTLINNS
jgi:hypothetical protein